MKDEFCYLEEEYFLDYIHDMNIVQQYAKLNRKAIANTILNKVDLKLSSSFTAIHNYIEIKEDKEKLIIQLVDMEELKYENKRLRECIKKVN